MIRRRRWTGAGARVAKLATSVLVATACTGSGTTNSDTAALVALVDSHCTDLATPGLGEGTLCVDNGFRPDTDDFSFANWGRSTEADGNISIQILVDLFGRAAVCAPGPETECILRPATVQRLEEWNNGLTGGRCEGFAVLSTRFFLGMEDPSHYRSGATRVADLRRGDGDLDRALAYWWTTQFLPEVVDRAAQSRTKSPVALVDEIIVGLAGGLGLTLGLYDNGAGHAVTPFAVTRRAGDFIVHVYDNNHPGERREIVVDPSTETWTYARAVLGADSSWSDWSGGTGRFEVTPMSTRRGPFRCDFCTSLAHDAGTVVSVASREPTSAGLLRIVSRTGTFAVTPEGIENSIEGAQWRSTKGGSANLTVTIPSSAGDLDVSILRENDSLPAGDVIVGVRRPDNPDLQIQGDLAGTTGTASPVLLVRTDGTTVRAPSGAAARVSIASGSGLSRTTVAAGEELTVRKIAADEIEVALKGSGAARIVDEGRWLARTISARNGGLAVETSSVAAVPIRPAARPGFSRTQTTVPPSAPVPPSRVTTTTTDPDEGPPPSIVVTLPD